LQSVVTVRECQAVQQCHSYLLTYYPTGTRVTNYPITAGLSVTSEPVPEISVKVAGRAAAQWLLPQLHVLPYFRRLCNVM